jgi:hypothetical protein
MISNNENTNNILDLILYLAFFFIFTFSSSDKSDRQSSYALSCSSQYELVYGYDSSHPNAVVVDHVYLERVPEICMNKIYHPDLILYNEHYRIAGYNKKISLSIKSFQKTLLGIEPVPIWKFYFHLTSFDSEDSSFLS